MPRRSPRTRRGSRNQDNEDESESPPRRSRRISQPTDDEDQSPSQRSRRSTQPTDDEDMSSPQRSRRSTQPTDDENSSPPKRSRRKTKSPASKATSPLRRARRIAQTTDDEEEDVAEEEDHLIFSQQVPEMSQDVLPERPSDRRNLENMDAAAREKALTSLSRLILMKALDCEPIDRLKVAKDAGISESRITSAAFQEAADRLHNVFGFELKRMPRYMEEQKSIPKRFRDRLYVLNEVQDTENGAHSRAIHSIHPEAAVEKGFLLLTLALIFCKGEPYGDGTRWALSRDLYRLLHSVDENIPEEPPQQGTARAKAVHQMSRLRNANMTPNADCLLDKFVQQEYLIKEKATEENFTSQTLEEGDYLYSMGPRAAMEVGRKQIIHFCAEILDEDPDPSMLAEVEDDGEQLDETYMEPLDQTQ